MTTERTRIDMRHGFMKSVIRNQIDRDNYDKQMKMEKPTRIGSRPSSVSSQKAKKPDMSVYQPPPHRTPKSLDSTEDEKIESSSERKILFKLEYVDAEDKEHVLFVMNDTDLKQESERFGAALGLCPPFVKALQYKLETESDRIKKMS